MNKFEEKFFKKYTPEGQEIKGIIHQHWIKIIKFLFVRILLFTFIPSFLYYNSQGFQKLIPFYIFEIFLIFVFIKIIYEIFNRYNDVWIITNSGVVDLDWALFNTDMKTVKYNNIEGIEVEQVGIWDTILNKGDLVIHKIGDDSFVLEDAIIPYDAVDEIERISKDENEDEKQDKFDIIMDALSGVVENYLKKEGVKKYEDNDHINKDNNLDDIKEDSGTIDLRNI